MSDGNKLLSKFSGVYGAPMGRRTIQGNLEAKVRLFRMRMSACGAYDAGGVYWGNGRPIYACIGEDFQYFIRANSRAEAKAAIKEEFPDLRFYQ